MDIQPRLLGLIEEIAAEHQDLDAQPPSARLIEAATSVEREVKEVLQILVDLARADGTPWAQIASARGLSNASSAHYLYGTKPGLALSESREEKLAAQRSRIAAYRSTQPHAEPMPGLSAIEAGRRLGVDRRTVKQKALRGEIETTTVTSAKGTPITRYLLPDEAIAASTG